ncbi:hypothetical protein AGR4C_Lc50107 [Agrobacterium tumefaciens str. Kerr 14]|uniref:Uncharacterized protein n=1 Tax=Agrobacterium tumefaciens str. Kerr 14 TaxID=1183424 RepID=A0A1S7RUT8_AGRTU|nr:hypothetical protein AGR4C_Lc50107 [Agrobacterium tumefaciens str. Kerr 14]
MRLDGVSLDDDGIKFPPPEQLCCGGPIGTGNQRERLAFLRGSATDHDWANLPMLGHGGRYSLGKIHINEAQPLTNMDAR